MKQMKYQAVVATIPNHSQRYRTCGDWFHEENGTLRINVSNTGNKDYEFLVAIHEMIEQYLCEKAGITEQQVDTWDLTHEDVDEPGEMMNCPYREHHQFAEAVEKVIAEKIGVDWREYGKRLQEAMDEKPQKPQPYIADPKPSRKTLMLRTKRILAEQEG